MSRLTEKQLLFLTIGITVLLSGGIGFLIWSDFKAIDEEEIKIADLKKQITSAESEIRLIPMREYRVISNREISDREVAFLPEEEEIENFWEVLERFAIESGVRISEIAPSSAGGPRGRNRRGAKPTTISSVPQIMSLRGTVNEFLRFINMIENFDRIINVAEYSISASDSADEDGKVRHGIRLALTTFTYSKKIASTIVSIPKYEEKREHPEVKKWLSRIKIQEKETYTLQPSIQRRDPFVSIRKLPITVEAAGDEPNRQMVEGIIDNLVELIRTLQEGLDYEQELQKRGDLWRLQAQRQENRDIFRELAEAIPQSKRDAGAIADLQERLESEVVAPWTDIQKRMDEMQKGSPVLTPQQVQEWLEKVKSHFDERAWGDVENEVRSFMDASKQGQHVAEEARALVQEITDMRRSARVIQNFEKRNIKISAILYSPNGMSVAVINGKQMAEEDALDAEGTILVVEIGENYVIFETEGVEIKRMQ